MPPEPVRGRLPVLDIDDPKRVGRLDHFLISSGSTINAPSRKNESRTRTASAVSLYDLLSVLPRLPQLVAVEEPENAAHQNEHDLVERPRHGRESERAAPPDRPRDSPVADDALHRADRSPKEGAHASSLGRGSSGTCLARLGGGARASLRFTTGRASVPSDPPASSVGCLSRQSLRASRVCEA
jgi:hypothetical protein